MFAEARRETGIESHRELARYLIKHDPRFKNKSEDSLRKSVDASFREMDSDLALITSLIRELIRELEKYAKFIRSQGHSQGEA